MLNLKLIGHQRKAVAAAVAEAEALEYVLGHISAVMEPVTSCHNVRVILFQWVRTFTLEKKLNLHLALMF